MLVAKEKYIADFYFRTKVYRAARFRYRNIMKQYDDNDLLLLSMARVVESSLKMKDKKTCTRDASAFIEVLTKKEQAVKDKLKNLNSMCEEL